MTLRFVKMQGLGNDFVVLDDLAQPLPANFNFDAAARFLCDRHLGVGGDGLLLLTSPTDNLSTVQMRMWNPDGTEDMCGNGLRCIVALAHLRGYAGEQFFVQTLAGRREAHVLLDGNVRVTMGEPSFELNEIPFAPSSGALSNETPIEYELAVGGLVIPHVTSLSTGSTHTVIFGPHPDEATFQRLSPLIENHEWFLERTSIMWAHVVAPDEIQLRIWERGVGETLACGTGACATAVAAQVTGRAERFVSVSSKGGSLKIEWSPGQTIWKTGPARVVYEGVTMMER